MYYDRMELSLAHVRTMIDDLCNSYAYQHGYPRFKEETKAWINHLHDDLAVVDAWDFFMFIPVGVSQDLAQFPCLSAVREYICIDILWELGGEFWGLTGSGERAVICYVNEYEHRYG